MGGGDIHWNSRGSFFLFITQIDPYTQFAGRAKATRCKFSLALAPSLSQENVKRTEEITKEKPFPTPALENKKW